MVVLPKNTAQVLFCVYEKEVVGVARLSRNLGLFVRLWAIRLARRRGGGAAHLQSGQHSSLSSDCERHTFSEVNITP